MESLKSRVQWLLKLAMYVPGLLGDTPRLTGSEAYDRHGLVSSYFTNSIGNESPAFSGYVNAGITRGHATVNRIRGS